MTKRNFAKKLFEMIGVKEPEVIKIVKPELKGRSI